MRELLIFSIHKMEVETPFSGIGQSTSDEKRGSQKFGTFSQIFRKLVKFPIKNRIRGTLSTMFSAGAT
jgi:hypothetical protein